MVALKTNLEKFGIKEMARTGKVTTTYSILLNCQQPLFVATCGLYFIMKTFIEQLELTGIIATCSLSFFWVYYVTHGRLEP